MRVYVCVVSVCVHVYYVFVYVCRPCAHTFICVCAHAHVCVCTGGRKGIGGSSDVFIFVEQNINNTKRSSQQLKS